METRNGIFFEISSLRLHKKTESILSKEMDIVQKKMQEIG
jgi:hypothetical protein